jgi:hypothetical protein
MAVDTLEPSQKQDDLRKLDKWSNRYLHSNSRDLGDAVTWYRKANALNNVETTLMAVNHDHTRAIFVYLLQN